MWSGLPVELHEDDGKHSIELLCFAEDAVVDYGDGSDDRLWAGVEVGFKNYPHAEKFTYWIELNAHPVCWEHYNMDWPMPEFRYDDDVLEMWMIEIFEKHEKDIYEAFNGDMDGAK